MGYLASFIYGVSLFFCCRFFPFTGSIISFISVSFLLFSKSRGYKSLSGNLPPPASLFHVLQPVLWMAVLAASGFFYAKLMCVPAQQTAELAGEFIEINGIAGYEAVRLNPEEEVFSQDVEVRKAEDKEGKPLRINKIRVVGSTVLSPGTLYRMKVQIPGDAYFLNPGGPRNIPAGYAAETEDLGEEQEKNPFKKFFRSMRSALNSGIRGRFSANTAPFLMSVTTGERSLLAKDMNNAFSVTGLAHILSISGSHFGLLLFVLFGVIRFLVKLAPYRLLTRLTLYFTPSQIAAALCIPFMTGYLGISDMSPPAVRSFIMIIFFLSGLLIQRKGFWLNTLLLAAVIITVMQPDSLLDLSFQLSFIAVLCIGTAAEGARKNGSSERPKEQGEMVEAEKMKFKNPHGLSSVLMRFWSSALEFFRSSLRISLAVTIGTAPLTAYSFHYFSLISPVTNLIITPVIGFIILPAALLSSCVFLLSGTFPMHALIDRITGFVLSCIRYAAQWDFIDIKAPAFPPILLITFYSGLLLYVVLKDREKLSVMSDELKDKDPLHLTSHCLYTRHSLRITHHCLLDSSLITHHPSLPLGSSRITHHFLLSFAVAVIPIIIYAGLMFFEHRGMRITYLDVGQGDSAVVELPDKKTLVIDTGKNGFQAGEFLKYRGIRQVEAIVLSHGQSDHAGGLRHLVDNFRVSEVWDNGRLTYAEGLLKGVRHRGLQRGDTISGADGGYRITVLHPYEGFYAGSTRDADENNDSLVLKIQGRRHAFLFSGDIESSAGDNLAYLGEYLRSAVFKVPHHGSRSSLSGAFFRGISPAIAVISVGKKNPYGHPHSETLGMLRGVEVFRTDRDGAIGIKERPDGGLEVRTARDFMLSGAKGIGDEWLNLKKLFLVW